MTDTRSAEFLNLFVKIEKHIRRLAQARRGHSFTRLVRKLATTNPTIRRVANDLKEYADLRNAIVHDRRGGQPIAEPHQEAVDDLRRIAKIVLTPPRVADLGAMQVVTCSPSTPIGDAARTMQEKRFSQLPVYDGKEFVGLLTSSAIARWLGAELQRHDGLLEDRPVSEVLPHRDDSGTEAFVSLKHAIIDVVELFEATVRSGKDLDAVLVTRTGRQHERPVYILTVFDLPQLYQKALPRSAA